MKIPSEYLPKKNVPLARQNAITILSLLVWGEARGELRKFGRESLDAVAHVAMNRLNNKSSFGKTIQEVCLKKKQFSCFNPDDPNREKMFSIIDGVVWRECVDAALDAWDGVSIDPTNGATHYVAMGCNPTWVSKMQFIKQIGNHRFYK